MSNDVPLSAGIVARRCACQGWMVGPAKPGREATDAVVKHQLDEPHKSWDRGEWIEANTTQVEVPIVTLVKVA